MRLSGMHLTQQELLEIVQMVETTFAKGQRRPFRRAHTLGIPQPENQLGDILELNKAESVSAISGFDREENEGPNAAAESAHSKYQS